MPAVSGVGNSTGVPAAGIDAAELARQRVEQFIRPHDSAFDPRIKALQRALNVLGARLVLDGQYGDNTEGAVRDFLDRDMPELQLGAGIRSRRDRAAVKMLQRALNVATGSQLTVDGKFGEGTENALIAWQESLGANNPSPRGQVNRATWNALLTSMVDEIAGPAPAPFFLPESTPVVPPTNGLEPPTATGVQTPGSGNVSPTPEAARAVEREPTPAADEAEPTAAPADDAVVAPTDESDPAAATRETPAVVGRYGNVEQQGAVGAGDSPNHPADVALVRGALARQIDSETARPYLDTPDGQNPGATDPAFLAALAKFQRDYTRGRDGVVEPGGITAGALANHPLNYLEGSVGEGADNRPADVVRVWQALTTHINPATARPYIDPGDGSVPTVDDALIGQVSSAVDAFQRDRFGWHDGKISPRRDTALALMQAPIQAIESSVGRGGTNAAADVARVQLTLESVGLLRPGSYTLGEVNEATFAAIERQQREVQGVSNPDGRIDVGGATSRALAALAGPARTVRGTLGNYQYISQFSSRNGQRGTSLYCYRASMAMAHRILAGPADTSWSPYAPGGTYGIHGGGLQGSRSWDAEFIQGQLEQGIPVLLNVDRPGGRNAGLDGADHAMLIVGVNDDNNFIVADPAASGSARDPHEVVFTRTGRYMGNRGYSVRSLRPLNANHYR